MSLIRTIGKEEVDMYEFILQSLETMGMEVNDLDQLRYLSPYLILDGHRTGTRHEMVTGYMNRAVFSLRFASILKEMGGRQATFLIHTLRNYKNRMREIIDSLEGIGEEFIISAFSQNIRLRYFGHEVHGEYTLSELINAAEYATDICDGFDLNYLINYSDTWASENKEFIDELAEISVIGRFTKGHYSGVDIPGKTSNANFTYIQQTSISDNWSDRQIIIMILGLLRSHIDSHREGERIIETIEKGEEYEFVSEEIPKRMIIFTHFGPATIKF